MQTKRRIKKITLAQEIEQTKVQIEQLSVQVLVVQELRMCLSQCVYDKASQFPSEEQKQIPILNEEEQLMIKAKMIYLIEKYFI